MKIQMKNEILGKCAVSTDRNSTDKELMELMVA